MALTAPQKVSVSEIVLESYDTVDSASVGLNSDQEASIIADLATWATIRNSHVKLKGGSDGVDFDNARKRAAIYYRIRNMLELPFITFYELSPGNFELVELEVGSNFG